MAKEKKVEENKSNETLAQKLNAIAAKNSQIITLRNVQEGKEKFKDGIGKRKSSSSSIKISGLEGLRPGLGQQFKKKTTDTD